MEKIKLLGVRGFLPTPKPKNTYGGNISYVEIRSMSNQIIIILSLRLLLGLLSCQNLRQTIPSDLL